MAEHDEVDAAALHDTLESVQKQLKLLTLKEALVRDSVQDDVEGFEALKAKVEQIEAENREFLEDAVRRKEKATGPQVMASLRRPAAMPFRQDTDLHGFQQTIKHIGKEEQEQLDAEADEDYARAAEQLAEVLESGSGAAAALTNDEKKLLASINSMKRSLAAQNDERAGQNEHKRAEEQLAAMLSQASAESATVMHSRAAVASAEAEASEMVEKAQQRRLESMKVAEESRTVLSKAGLALKRLGRAEWSEIKAMQAPTTLLVRMMGAVRLLLSDVDMDALTVQSELPLDWGACVKLLGHTRFVSRLLKLTRGTLKVPDVVYTIIQRRLTMDELAGLEGPLIDDSESASEAGSNRPRSDDGQEEIGRERKSHSVKMLGEWISALISHRTMHDVMDGARKELGEAEADLKAAADVLQAKAAEAKRVQKRMHKINSRISSLIAAQEAVPHRQALKRLHEYHNLREELVAVEGAHAALVEKVEQRKEKAREDAKAEMRGQMVVRHAGTPRRGRPGSREKKSPKATSRVAADAVQVLERIKQRHRSQAEEARALVDRFAVRKALQQEVTQKALQATTDNDMATLQDLVHEQADHAAKHPDTRDQYTVLEAVDAEGRMPLHYACCHGCFEAGMFLLTSGADPQRSTHAGFTPMHFAAAYGHLQMIVLLNQFDPNLTQLVDNMGQTPLHVASQQDNADCVSLLLKIGSDPRATDRTGSTPLKLTLNSSQAIRGVLQQSLEPVEEMNPIMIKTLQDLTAEFDEADAAFDELLADMHFSDAALQENRDAESQSETESESEPETSESDDEGSSRRSRPTSATSRRSTQSRDTDNSGAVSQASLESQRQALADAFGGSQHTTSLDDGAMSPNESRRLAEAQEAEEAALVAKEEKRLEGQRLGMSLFAVANADVVATRRRRAVAERRAAREAQMDGTLEQERLDELLEDERPTATPLSAGAGSALTETKPEYQKDYGTGQHGPKFGAGDFAALMLGDGDEEPEDADGRPTTAVSAVGAGADWHAIDISHAGAGAEQEDFGPGSAWVKPRYTDKGSMRVQFWKELRAGSDLAKLGYGRWHRAKTRPSTPPQDLTLDDITPAERVELRSVLPPPSDVRNKATKRTVKIRRKKGKMQGKEYIRGDVVGLEVEKPPEDQLNFFNDSITAGESQVFDYDSGGGRPAGAGKAALKKGVHAAMAGRKKKGNGGAMSQADAFKQRLDQRPYDAISGMNVDPRFALRE